MKYLLLLLLLTAHAKEDLPQQIIIDAVHHLQDQGLSKAYAYTNFALQQAIVTSSTTDSWESGTITWQIMINDELFLPYEVSVYKIGADFEPTSDYTLDDEIAYLFPTTHLHDITNVITLAEAQTHILDCTGNDALTLRLTKEGMLEAVAAIEVTEDSPPVAKVNLETGEHTCEQSPYKEQTAEQSFWSKLIAWIRELFT